MADSPLFAAGRAAWTKSAEVMDAQVPAGVDDLTDWVHGFFYQMILGLVFVRGAADTKAMLEMLTQAAITDDGEVRRH